MRVRVAPPAGRLAADQVGLSHVDQRGGRRSEQTHGDSIAAAGAPPGHDRRQNSTDRVQTGNHVGDGHADFHRRAVRFAGDRHQAAHALDRQVVARSHPLTERRDRAMDDSRVGRGDFFGAQSQTVGDTGREVLDQHVCTPEQIEEQVAAGFVLEVQADAPLGPVDRKIIRAESIARGAKIRRSPRTRVIPAGRPFDFDHVGPQIGQDHRAVRPGQNTGNVENRQPVQGRGRILLWLHHKKVCKKPAERKPRAKGGRASASGTGRLRQ